MTKCATCDGEGYLLGAETACPTCNPGGEWRRVGGLHRVAGSACTSAREITAQEREAFVQKHVFTIKRPYLYNSMKWTVETLDDRIFNGETYCEVLDAAIKGEGI